MSTRVFIDRYYNSLFDHDQIYNAGFNWQEPREKPKTLYIHPNHVQIFWRDSAHFFPYVARNTEPLELVLSNLDSLPKAIGIYDCWEVVVTTDAPTKRAVKCVSTFGRETIVEMRDDSVGNEEIFKEFRDICPTT